MLRLPTVGTQLQQTESCHSIPRHTILYRKIAVSRYVLLQNLKGMCVLTDLCGAYTCSFLATGRPGPVLDARHGGGRRVLRCREGDPPTDHVDDVVRVCVCASPNMISTHSQRLGLLQGLVTVTDLRVSPKILCVDVACCYKWFRIFTTRWACVGGCAIFRRTALAITCLVAYDAVAERVELVDVS